MASTLKLKSSDGMIFEVDAKLMEASATITTMLKDLNIEESDDEPIPLFNVSSQILEKVILWLDYHKDDPPPPPAAGSREDPDEDEQSDEADQKTMDLELSAWDTAFFDIDLETKTGIILAANYLDIQSLLDVACKSVALIIKSKTVEEIRDYFNIENDFTPEEEAQIRKENEWAEQK